MFKLILTLDMFNCLFLLIDSTVLTLICFSQFNNNAQSYTKDPYHNFIIQLHELDQSLIQTYFVLQHMPKSANTACKERS